MYLWVILATFLVALYSFNLSHRADIRSIEVEPLARAVLSKIIIKQQAADYYVRDHTPPKATIQNPDGSSVLADYVTYSPGVITQEELQSGSGASYFPYGYKDDSSITAEIYCLDKADPNLERPCSDENAVRYLVTYMPVPQKWLNIKTGLPNNELTVAMKEMLNYNTGFGYPLCKKYVENPDSGDRYCETLVLKNREKYNTSDGGEGEDIEGKDMLEFYPEIPAYISRNGDFANTCNNPKNENLCLMYIYEYKAKY